MHSKTPRKHRENTPLLSIVYRCIRGIEEGVYNGWGNIRYNGYCSGNIPREYPRRARHGTRTSVRTSHQGYKAYTGHQKSNDYEHLDPCMPACIPPNVCTTVRLVSTTSFYGAARGDAAARGGAARNTGKFSRETLFPARLGHPTHAWGDSTHYREAPYTVRRILPDITRILP